MFLNPSHWGETLVLFYYNSQHLINSIRNHALLLSPSKTHWYPIKPSQPPHHINFKDFLFHRHLHTPILSIHWTKNFFFLDHPSLPTLVYFFVSWISHSYHSISYKFVYIISYIGNIPQCLTIILGIRNNYCIVPYNFLVEMEPTNHRTTKQLYQILSSLFLVPIIVEYFNIMTPRFRNMGEVIGNDFGK